MLTYLRSGRNITVEKEWGTAQVGVNKRKREMSVQVLLCPNHVVCPMFVSLSMALINETLSQALKLIEK